MAESRGGFGTTVRTFVFDGDEVKYRSWEGKTPLALANLKEFLLALPRESTGTALTVEEFEYGEFEVTTGGGAATAAVMRPTTAAENRKYLARAAAWTYLVLASCTDKVYALIKRCEGDPYMAWSILQEKYCATDAEENYPPRTGSSI